MSLQCGVQGLDEEINFNSQFLIHCPMSVRPHRLDKMDDHVSFIVSMKEIQSHGSYGQ